MIRVADKYTFIRLPMLVVALTSAVILGGVWTQPGKVTELFEAVIDCSTHDCMFSVETASLLTKVPTECVTFDRFNRTECLIQSSCHEAITTFAEPVTDRLMCEFNTVAAPCNTAFVADLCAGSLSVTPARADALRAICAAVILMVAVAMIGEAFRFYMYWSAAGRNQNLNVHKRKSSKVKIVKTIISISTVVGAAAAAVRFSLLEPTLGDIHFWELLLMFSDKVLGAGLLMAAALTVAWPAEPIFATHLMKRLEALQESAENRRSTADGSSIRFHSAGSEALSLTSSDDTLNSIINHTLTGDVALVINCGFGSVDSKTLLSALGLFPPSHIFVCCQVDAKTALDSAEQSSAAIYHKDITYVQPPMDNMPSWFDCHLKDVSQFSFIMQIDSGCILPGNMHIPKERLKHDSSIASVHFAIDPPSVLDKLHCRRQSVFELLKDQLSAATFTFPQVSLWRKGSSGTDEKIIASLQTPIRVEAADQLLASYSVFSLLWQVTNPDTFRKRKGLGLLKLFALYDLASVMSHYIRPLMFATISTRGWLSLAVALGAYSACCMFEFLLLSVVLRKRPDLRLPVWMAPLAPVLTLVSDLRFMSVRLGLDLLGRIGR